MTRGDTAKPASGYTSHYDSHTTHIYERPIFQYIIVLSIIATLVISAFSLVNTYELKKIIVPLTPKTINSNDFLKKMTLHAEAKGYVGVAPLNIIQINNNNLANLQSQINGLDTSYVGNFLVQYNDRIVLYDYDNDKVRGSVSLQQPQQAQVPHDFYIKLNKHPELQGLEKQQPIGGQLDENALNTLKQQFTEVYANAKVGDFLLRYQTKLIIYDYKADKIVNAVSLS